MTLRQQIVFWLAALGVLIFCLWLFSDILLPFIVGLVLAYFLDPLADILEDVGAPRLVATITIMAVAIIIFVFIVILLVPVLSGQIANFLENLPSTASQLVAMGRQMSPQWLKDALASAGLDGHNTGGELTKQAAGWLASLAGSVWSGGLALVNVISLAVVTPIVVFYMLNDWDRMVARVDGWLPRDHLETIRAIARDIDAAMAGFIRGQGTVCLILGLFYAVGLSLAGLNFGLLIGIGAGVLSFIPYVGSIVGGTLAIGTALVQFWPDWVQVAMVAAVFALGQFLEGNFLSPKLVGGRIGLHPVWLMFALFAFGYLFGLVGVFLAVPMAAAIGVLARFALRQYMASRLYRGSGRGRDPAPPAS